MSLLLDGTLGETLPTWTTAGRPASPTTGLTGYNTTLNIREVWNGSAWTADSLPAAGTSGNVLKSDGTNWTSGTAASGQIQTQLFTAPGTWTNPGTVTQVRVIVVGGGGGGGNPGPFGGSGGVAVAIVPIPASPVAVTVGTGGTSINSGPTTPGNTSSFGSFVSATGAGAPTPGSGTVTTGTALKTGNVYGLAGYPGVTAGVNISGIQGVSNTGTTPVSFPSPGTPAAPYSATGSAMAGWGGPSYLNQAISGAVLVEFVG